MKYFADNILIISFDFSTMIQKQHVFITNIFFHGSVYVIMNITAFIIKEGILARRSSYFEVLGITMLR